MSVHFDLDRLPPFAESVTDASPTLATLDADIGGLREEALPLLGGASQPSDLRPGVAAAPGDVGERLPDLATEIKRRISMLETIQFLQVLGIDVDPATAFALTTVDQEEVDAAVSEVRTLLERDDFGVNGNRDDIERVMAELDGLGGAEIDAVIDALSDTEIAELGEMVNDTGDSGWNPLDSNGLPRWGVLDFYHIFLSQASPSRIDRLADGFPGVNPGFTTTDAYLDGVNAQTGESALGVEWGVPEGEVFEIGPDGRPLVDATQMDQGQLGNCWFIASTMAAQQANPDFIPTHVRPNANGTVSVKMYDDGNEHWVTVTPELPLDENGDPLGAESDDDLLWGAYYEKAFALAYQDDDGGASDRHQGDPTFDRAEQGSYGATEWDYTENAAPYITGHEADDLGHDFDAVQEAFGDGQPVLISTPGGTPTPPSDWGNAYSTRHVYFVKSVDGDTITVGNPWGASYEDIEMTEDEFDSYFGDATTMQFEE